MDMEMKKNIAALFEQEDPGLMLPSTVSIVRNERLLNYLDRNGFLTDPTAKEDPKPKKECATCTWARNGPTCGWLNNGEAKTGQKRTYPGRAHWTPKRLTVDFDLKEPGDLLFDRPDWELLRRFDLKRAIAWNADHGLEIPREWTDEFNELLRRTRG